MEPDCSTIVMSRPAFITRENTSTSRYTMFSVLGRNVCHLAVCKIIIIIIIIVKFVKRHMRSYTGASGGVNQAA